VSAAGFAATRLSAVRASTLSAARVGSALRRCKSLPNCAADAAGASMTTAVQWTPDPSPTRVRWRSEAARSLVVLAVGRCLLPAASFTASKSSVRRARAAGRNSASASNAAKCAPSPSLPVRSTPRSGSCSAANSALWPCRPQASLWSRTRSRCGARASAQSNGHSVTHASSLSRAVATWCVRYQAVFRRCTRLGRKWLGSPATGGSRRR